MKPLFFFLVITGITAQAQELDQDSQQIPDSRQDTTPYYTDAQEFLEKVFQYGVKCGYTDSNQDGVPDVLERNGYQVGRNDCSTMSAQILDIVKKMAEEGLIECSQGEGAGVVVGGGDLGAHATCYIPGIGIVDTLGSTRSTIGKPWFAFPNSDTHFIKEYGPDLGEITDPAYSGPGPRNINDYGASSIRVAVVNEDGVTVDIKPFDAATEEESRQSEIDYLECMRDLLYDSPDLDAEDDTSDERIGRPKTRRLRRCRRIRRLFGRR